jgi:peptidoglycan/xylan/chitin deacetylase (PgdA/CDA1 family)
VTRAAALGGAAALGFLLTVSADAHLNSAATIVLAALAITAGGAIGNRLPGTRGVIVSGALLALVACWLLPQRDDLAVALILAVLFGFGIGCTNRAAAPVLVAIGLAALAVLARIFGPQTLIATIAATGVVVAALLSLTSSDRVRAPRSVLVTVVIVLLATTIFTAYIGAETPAATWFGGGITHGPTSGNEVALTFDDGPDVTATLPVMAILDRYRVKATFFEVGKAVNADPSITRDLYADGQLLGNHSYHHDQWRWLDPRYPELQRDQNAISRATGVCPGLYRPPHGDRTPFVARVVKDHHMHMVLWSVSAGDWATNDPELVARRILRGAKPGAILLLHDGLDGNPTANRQVVVAALPLILDGLRAKGLNPVRLDQLLHVSPYVKC